MLSCERVSLQMSALRRDPRPHRRNRLARNGCRNTRPILCAARAGERGPTPPFHQRSAIA